MNQGFEMIVTALANFPPQLPADWHERWEGTDAGLIAAWARGIQKRFEDPELSQRAKAGELPVLAWRGGVEKPIRAEKSGTLFYLATWQGLRGDDLNIDTEQEIRMTCQRHGVTVVYSAKSSGEDESAS